MVFCVQNPTIYLTSDCKKGKVMISAIIYSYDLPFLYEFVEFSFFCSIRANLSLHSLYV